MLSSTSSLWVGDYIGMESCVDLKNNDELCISNNHDDRRKQRRSKREQRLARKEKHFPPPIPLLARTENLPSHMPWVLKRHYTSDGRLILTEEKVRHHEYLRAHRSNGRLTLHLVPLDNDVSEEEDEEEEDHYCGGCREAGVGVEQIVDVDEVSRNDDHKMEGHDVDIGVGGKCLSFNDVRASGFFGVAVPATRIVLT